MTTKGYTPLFGAADSGHADVVAALLCASDSSGHGIDVNMANKNGTTALMLAASGGGHIESLRC